MKYFPMFTDIAGKPVIICGDNQHTYEKITRLLPFSCDIHVFAPQPSASIRAIQEIHLHQRALIETDLDLHPIFVVAASDPQENERIVAMCRKHHILVNAVDMPAICDFIFPAIIAKEHLCVAVSSGGTSPTAAMHIKDQMDRQIPEHIDEILEWMFEIRPYVKKQVPCARQKQVLRKLTEKAFQSDRVLADHEVSQIIASDD